MVGLLITTMCFYSNLWINQPKQTHETYFNMSFMKGKIFWLLFRRLIL